jgi:hypothetical protein
MGVVIALVWSYGLWIALAVVFLTMHWFGMHYCGSGRERRTPPGTRPPSTGEPDNNTARMKIRKRV